jgi:hypothetical protein
LDWPFECLTARWSGAALERVIGTEAVNALPDATVMVAPRMVADDADANARTDSKSDDKNDDEPAAKHGAAGGNAVNVDDYVDYGFHNND